MRVVGLLLGALCLVQLGQVSALKVLVTGAGGKTGSLVFQQLLQAGPDVEAKGLVRSTKSANKLVKRMNKKMLPKDAPRLDASKVVVADVTNAESLTAAMEDCDALLVCTSAVPKPKVFSIIKFLFKSKVLRQKNPGRMEFNWSGGPPEETDWLGQKNQFDAAKAAGVKHVVLVGSMGGTQKDNFLNTIGSGTTEGSQGLILAWKRKAEQYLINSGLMYTIVHPGGLLNDPGYKRKLRIGVDDELLENEYRSVPREDVARVCVHALSDQTYHNRSFDLASFKEGEGDPTLDLEKLIDSLGDKNCDYSKTPALLS